MQTSGQTDTFRKWVNLKLAQIQFRSPLPPDRRMVREVSEDLSDGVLLAELSGSLLGLKQPIKIHYQPRVSSRKVENILTSLTFLKEHGVVVSLIDAESVHRGEVRSVNQLIWSLMVRFQLGGDGRREGSRKSVLSWIRAALPGHKIPNLTTSWNNGILLSKLISYLSTTPRSFPDYGNHTDICGMLLDTARRDFGVPHILSADHLASPLVDEESVAAYLTLFSVAMSASLLRWLREVLSGRAPKTISPDDWRNGELLGQLLSATAQISTNHRELRDLFSEMQERLGITSPFSSSELRTGRVDLISLQTLLLRVRHFHSATPTLSSSTSDRGVVSATPTLSSSTSDRGVVSATPTLSSSTSGRGVVSATPTLSSSTSGRGVVSATPTLRSSTSDRGVVSATPTLRSSTSDRGVVSATPTLSSSTSGRGVVSATTTLSSSTSGRGVVSATPTLRSSTSDRGVVSATPTLRSSTSDRGVVSATPTLRSSTSDRGVVSATPTLRSSTSDRGVVSDTLPLRSSTSDRGVVSATLPLRSSTSGRGVVSATLPLRSSTSGRGVVSATLPLRSSTSGRGVVSATPPLRSSTSDRGVVSATPTLSSSTSGRGVVSTTLPLRSSTSGRGVVSATAGRHNSFLVDTSSREEVDALIRNGKEERVDESVRKADTHLVSRHIPNSPYRIQTTNPNAVKIVDRDSITREIQVGRRCEVLVSSRGAGEGIASGEVRYSGDSLASVQIESVSKSVGLHSLQLTPQREGEVSLHIFWDDIPIHGSPLHFTAVSPPDYHIDTSFLPRDEVTGELLGVPLNEAVRVYVRAEHGLVRHLTAVVTHNDTKLSPYVSLEKHRSYWNVWITPDTTGYYEVCLETESGHIPGSPFCLPACDASRVLLESSQLPQHLQLDCPLQLLFSTQDAGPGELTFHCDGAVTCSMSRTGHSISAVMLATRVGEFVYSLKWGSEHIPNSPFRVSVCDIRNLSVTSAAVEDGSVPLGEEVEFYLCHLSGTADVDCVALKLSASGPNTQCDVAMQDEGPGQTVARFTPCETGEHRVEVFLGEIELERSPFYFEVSSADSMATSAYGDGLRAAEAGLPAYFYIGSPELGLLASERLYVRAHSIHGDVKCVTSAGGDGTYRVAYTPKRPGAYLVEVWLDGTHIPGSPFKLSVHPNRNQEFVDCQLSGPALNPDMKFTLGQPVDFTVDATSGPPGDLWVSAVRDEGQVAARVVMHQYRQGFYQVNIDPPEVGVYTVSVSHAGNLAPDTPFSVEIVPSDTDASKCRAHGPGLNQAAVGERTEFYVSTHQAGRGALAVTVEGVKRSFVVNVDPSPSDARELCCRYKPRSAGTFFLALKWSGQHIPGSPFCVEVGGWDMLGGSGVSLTDSLPDSIRNLQVGDNTPLPSSDDDTSLKEFKPSAFLSETARPNQLLISSPAPAVQSADGTARNDSKNRISGLNAKNRMPPGYSILSRLGAGRNTKNRTLVNDNQTDTGNEVNNMTPQNYDARNRTAEGYAPHNTTPQDYTAKDITTKDHDTKNRIEGAFGYEDRAVQEYDAINRTDDSIDRLFSGLDTIDRTHQVPTERIPPGGIHRLGSKTEAINRFGSVEEAINRIGSVDESINRTGLSYEAINRTGLSNEAIYRTGSVKETINRTGSLRDDEVKVDSVEVSKNRRGSADGLRGAKGSEVERGRVLAQISQFEKRLPPERIPAVPRKEFKRDPSLERLAERVGVKKVADRENVSYGSVKKVADRENVSYGSVKKVADRENVSYGSVKIVADRENVSYGSVKKVTQREDILHGGVKKVIERSESKVTDRSVKRSKEMGRLNELSGIDVSKRGVFEVEAVRTAEHEGVKVSGDDRMAEAVALEKIQRGVVSGLIKQSQKIPEERSSAFESPSLKNLREAARVRRTKEQLMELSSKNSRPQSADVSLKPADDSKNATETAVAPADGKREKGDKMRFRKVASEKSKIRTEAGFEKSRRKRDSIELRQRGKERVATEEVSKGDLAPDKTVSFSPEIATRHIPKEKQRTGIFGMFERRDGRHRSKQMAVHRPSQAVTVPAAIHQQQKAAQRLQRYAPPVPYAVPYAVPPQPLLYPPQFYQQPQYQYIPMHQAYHQAAPPPGMDNFAEQTSLFY